ncbi:substrate-binding domain-containing protein, partial [Paenibacillus elgii]
MEAANKANIPVITHRPRNERRSSRLTYRIRQRQGRTDGRQLHSQSDRRQRKYRRVQGIAGTSAARDRGKGFHNAVDGKDGVKMVASQPADFDRAKGLSVMENILQGNKDIAAVFAHNDEMALGACRRSKPPAKT